MTNSEPVSIPIDGILDLHAFSPKDIKHLVPDYLEECRRKGIYEVRIIHGKGTGTLRRTVHAILERLPQVLSYQLAGLDSGSWGATLITLRSSSGTTQPVEKKIIKKNGLHLKK